MATLRTSSTDDIEINDSNDTSLRAETRSSERSDTALFNKFKVLKAPEHTLFICPFDSSATTDPNSATAIYMLKTTREWQKRPDFTISTCKTSSPAQNTSVKTTPTLGVAYLYTRYGVLGLGDPAVEIGEEAIAWEKMSMKSKWSHKIYKFEVSLAASTSGGEEGKRTEERRSFEWRRCKILRMEMELVEVGKGKDEGLVLAYYLASPMLRSMKEKGVLAFRKDSPLGGTRWEVIVILSALSLYEMNSRRD